MPEGRTRELSAGEEARLFAHLRPDYQPLFWFLLMSGVRVSNATGLKWDQVDFHERKIVFRTKSRRPGRKLHVLPMTNAMLTLLANQSGHHPSFVFTFVCQKTRVAAAGMFDTHSLCTAGGANGKVHWRQPVSTISGPTICDTPPQRGWPA